MKSLIPVSPESQGSNKLHSMFVTLVHFAGDDFKFSKREMRYMIKVLSLSDHSDFALDPTKLNGAPIGMATNFSSPEERVSIEVCAETTRLSYMLTQGKTTSGTLKLTEQALLVIYIYFAGDNLALDIDENADMRYIIRTFNLKQVDDMENKQIAINLLETLTVFDFDKDGDLDEVERSILIPVVKFFAATDSPDCGSEVSNPDKCKGWQRWKLLKMDKDYVNMATVIKAFEGEPPQLSEQMSHQLLSDGRILDDEKAYRMMLVLMAFDKDPDEELDDVEQGNLLTVVKYFSDGEDRLKDNAWEVLRVDIQYFARGTERLSVESQNALIQDCRAYDENNDGSLDDRELETLKKDLYQSGFTVEVLTNA